MKNCKGTSISSCATLHVMLEIPENGFSKFTENFRFDRKDGNYLMVSSEKPIILNFLNSVSCLIISSSF